MLNIPNLITFLRLALLPVMGWFLAAGDYGLALLLFLAAALSDLLDGFIARTFDQSSVLGATLDPIADKLNMFVTTVLLAWHGLLPLWLAIAVVLRDVVIVVGAIAYRVSLGHLEIAPTLMSKANTFLEFTVLLLVMAQAAEWIPGGGWMAALFMLTFATVAASGAQYVWIWGRKAARDRRGVL
ncbi:MAG: CDP-alcohol phosphatidyltransferase family protein [Burkholderiales bacterium]